MIRIKNAWAIPLVVATLSASACGVRTKTTQVSPVTRAPTCDEAIDVYTSRQAVPHDYYELAWISAEANSVYTSDNKVVDKIRKQAAEKGANAIIVNDFATTGSNSKIIGAALGGNTADTKTSALAIYMPDEASRVTLKCGK
ncbi:MAG TPA: hypothetical protein VM099_00805 [Gemmatimonadaceae bacterium]|nr:hypothetical protein [Gemmatimonadaceae bacterium]